MDKETYERLKTQEGEEELCELIIKVLDEAQQRAAHLSNQGNGEVNQFYWLTLALSHAIQYVEDWTESVE